MASLARTLCWLSLLSSCSQLVVAECAFLCDANQTCPRELTCGTDGYCHGDSNLDHCTTASDGGTDGANSIEHNFAFVTSQSYTPGVDYHNLAEADAICQARAQVSTVAGLSGRTYLAWLSDENTDARTRLVKPGGAAIPARGWVRSDGKPFADSIDSLLTDGKVFYPLRLDEFGSDLVASNAVFVATGTTPTGTRAPQTASSWTAQSAQYIAGDASMTTQGWTQSPAGPAQGASRLYCFGVDHSNALVVTAPSGRRAFVTHATLSASQGRDAADALCASEALAQSIPGTFVALVSATGASAASRFSTTGDTWVRLDGVSWIAAASQLSSSTPLTALNLDSTGEYLGAATIWAGADTQNAACSNAGECCANWSSTSQTAITGWAFASNARWFNNTTGTSCGTPAHIYCLAQ